MLDGFPVFATTLAGEAARGGDVKQEWKQRHVRQSKYLLQVRFSSSSSFVASCVFALEPCSPQVVKCSDTQCCGRQRSSLARVIGGQFMPPPWPATHTPSLALALPSSPTGDFLPLFAALQLRSSDANAAFDLFCPSRRDAVAALTCPACGIYHGTARALRAHASVHPAAMAVAHDDSDEADDEAWPNTGPAVIRDLASWMPLPWEEA